MESDSVGCPNCKTPYQRVEGNTLVCDSCGHIETPTRKLSYDELLEENKKLKQKIEELTEP